MARLICTVFARSTSFKFYGPVSIVEPVSYLYSHFSWADLVIKGVIQCFVHILRQQRTTAHLDSAEG